MEKKKILITYATYGSGHKTVANYIYDYFKKRDEYDVKIMDLMDYENAIGLISKKAFETNFKSRTSSAIFSFIYEFFDYKMTTLPYKPIVKAVFKNKKLNDAIISYQPDLVISTHFFGNIIIGRLNKKKLTNTKIISIITDYVSHEMWLKDEKNVDAFIVSNDIVKNELLTSKISSKKIYSFGIPLSEKFINLDDINIIKNKYKINNGKKTVLFFAGGSIGSSFSYKYFKKIVDEEYDINIIYVCGKNDKLRYKAKDYIIRNNYKNVFILGFSNEVNNLLNISDLVITKPGGLSITECLEMKKPMLLIPGNGGNEIYNARFVCRNGYGFNCKTPRKLNKVLGKIIKRKNILQNMKRKLNKYDNNKSIEKIYKLTNKLIGK